MENINRIHFYDMKIEHSKTQNPKYIAVSFYGDRFRHYAFHCIKPSKSFYDIGVWNIKYKENENN